jgi:glycerol-3-phosphate dehydrogenase
VREALHERGAFMKMAPYLAKEVPIMLPLMKYMFIEIVYGRFHIIILARKHTIYWQDPKDSVSPTFCPKPERLKHFQC